MYPQSPGFDGQNPYPAVDSRRVGRANAPIVERQFGHTIRDSKTANRARRDGVRYRSSTNCRYRTSYTYSSGAHLELAVSYRADDDPFPADTSFSFPRRNHLRKDVDFIKCPLFLRYWNAGLWVIDEELLRDDAASFGALCYSGIDSYIDEDPKPIVDEIVKRLPDIRERLKKDAGAAYKGDPTMCSYVEIIRSYPDVQAVVIHRVAHAFYGAGVPVHARELAEYAKMESGTDIHPGATIGDYFFIDCGTGAVIGETTTIGEWVRICQDVMPGAFHFEEGEDDEHSLKKGYKRYPDIDDSVVIGVGTKVFGTVSVGDHVSIGANSWVTEDVPDHTNVYISEHPTHERKHRD